MLLCGVRTTQKVGEQTAITVVTIIAKLDLQFDTSDEVTTCCLSRTAVTHAKLSRSALLASDGMSVVRSAALHQRRPPTPTVEMKLWLVNE